MSKDPQFFYLMLLLPVLFGLTLFGEGLYKIINHNKEGWFSLVMGGVFVTVVVFAFLLWQKI